MGAGGGVGKANHREIIVSRRNVTFGSPEVEEELGHGEIDESKETVDDGGKEVCLLMVEAPR